MTLSDLLNRILSKWIKRIFDGNELRSASVIYNVAREDISGVANEFYEHVNEGDGKNSISSFDEKIEAVIHNFDHVIDLFKKTNEAQNAFLKNFEEWSSIRKRNIKRLKEIAEKIQKDKFNGDISKVVGGVIGVIGGAVGLASLVTPVAALAVPLAIGGGVPCLLGSSVIIGTVGTETILLKKKLKEVKTFIMQEQESFTAIANWFIHSKELEKVIESLVGCNLMNELADAIQKFLGKAKDLKELVNDINERKFVKIVMMCVEKILKLKNVKDVYCEIIAPVVMIFVIVVGVSKVHNQRILDCTLVTHNLLRIMRTTDIAVQLSQMKVIFSGKIAPAAVASAASTGIFIALIIVIDVLNVVLSSKDIHIRAESRHAQEIKEAAEMLEQEHSFIERIYNKLKNK